MIQRAARRGKPWGLAAMFFPGSRRVRPEYGSRQGRHAPRLHFGSVRGPIVPIRYSLPTLPRFTRKACLSRIIDIRKRGRGEATLL